MISKQIFISIILLTTFSDNFYAMDDKTKNEKLDTMTCHRKEGYWHKTWHKKDKLYFFPTTSKKDQREPWHQYSRYIAEPWCALSNIPFFIAAHAIKNSHPLSAAALESAGTLSAISHAIPYQYLNNLDKIAALLSVAAVTYDAKLHNPAELRLALYNPKKLLALAAVTGIKLADFWVARSKQIVENSKGKLPQSLIVARKPEHQWIHVMWHLIAAWAAYVLLTS